MTHNHERKHNGETQDFFTWRARTSTTTPTISDDDLVADVDEPPDPLSFKRQIAPDFHKSSIRPQNDRKESLLTKALQPHPDLEIAKTQVLAAIEMTRRRSTISNASVTSTVDLTSDGGITSPARTDTPSPPFPNSTYLSFAPYAVGAKPTHPIAPPMVKLDPRETVISRLPTADAAMPKPDPSIEALVKKRCISFACGGQKPKPRPVESVLVVAAEVEAPKKRSIKFACLGPKPTAKTTPVVEKTVQEKLPATSAKIASPAKTSRSPSITRKYRPASSPHPKAQRDSISTTRRSSQSPAAVRTRRPNYISADSDTLRLSEATRFHEFASDEPQEDDWIRQDASETKVKLTINDTLKKENAIRLLGKQAEEEALADEEDEDEDDAGDESDDENDDDAEDQDEDEDDDEDELTIDGSDDDEEEFSDGNETDNEAGFADSDDESDAAGDYQFWTPGQSIFSSEEPNNLRPSARRTASESSIDSLKHMSPIAQTKSGVHSGRLKPSRKIKIRPGTPDLPDSTDFVCGTLDEDRPLEEAYVSCMEARKRQKHHLIPQDIDPSFPTSDPEDNDDNEAEEVANDSEEEQVWLHGKFEDSSEGSRSRRRSVRKSPNHSPKRLHSPPPPKRHHSPPPAKNRHRSPPPPRRLFGGSPKRLRSPPPARVIQSPAGSPTTPTARGAISFAPLGRRPGLTHTKSLPRRPNGFCQIYREARLAAANDPDNSDFADGHTRGAIDIVKGLERKRQRRKEKFYQKQCNRARKGQQPERKPQPGKGAERMRELGLHMAGKVEYRNGKAEYVLSI